jgi:hypothetical protein
MVTVMYAPNDLRIIGVCDGPAAEGRCPRVARGEEVHCWGLDLVLSGDDVHRAPGVVGRPRFRVAPGTTLCPLTGMMGYSRGYFSPFEPRT